MGLNCVNIRVLPFDADIYCENEYWKVRGCSNVFEKDLINSLLDIGYKIKSLTKQCYKINKIYDILISTEESKIKYIEIKFCLCYLEEGLIECYNMLLYINKIMPLKYYIYNDCGNKLISKEAFVSEYLKFCSEKYSIFVKTYPKSIGKRISLMKFYKKYV